MMTSLEAYGRSTRRCGQRDDRPHEFESIQIIGGAERMARGFNRLIWAEASRARPERW